MGQLTARDCTQLAGFHRECLPDSLVSRLGDGYARASYRYVSQSADERVFHRRDADQIISACVLSLAPQSLTRRRIFGTPLLWFAALGVVRLSLARWLLGSLGRRSAAPYAETPPSLPEVILIFTTPRGQGKGLGSDLLDECERVLAARGSGEYLVRTVDNESNAALRFYAKNGFVECGRCVELGRPFRMLRKRIGAATPAAHGMRDFSSTGLPEPLPGLDPCCRARVCLADCGSWRTINVITPGEESTHETKHGDYHRSGPVRDRRGRTLVAGTDRR
jgi:ribosomal protein S18 acetylase RimI-like enzyme